MEVMGVVERRVVQRERSGSVSPREPAVRIRAVGMVTKGVWGLKELGCRWWCGLYRKGRLMAGDRLLSVVGGIALFVPVFSALISILSKVYRVTSLLRWPLER